MLGLFKRTKAYSGRIGVALNPGAVALAVVNRNGDGAPILERCTVLPLVGAASPQVIGDALRAAGLPRMPVSAVLSARDYQLALMEAPDVAPAELRAAMRWKIRETIDFPVDEAVIDVFDMPTEGRRTQGRMVYAVVSRRQQIQQQVAAFAGLPGFDVIDVPELSLRNLVSLLPASSAGVAILHVGDSIGTIVLVRSGTFYFARQMQLQKALDIDATEGADDRIDAVAVALELQRSLDYYERHFDQPPITNIAIAPAGPRARALVKELAAETGLNVTEYDLNVMFQCGAPVEPDVQAACLLAVGAALRNDERKL